MYIGYDLLLYCTVSVMNVLLLLFHRISLNTMTLNVESPRVYTRHGVPISVTGIAQVSRHECSRPLELPLCIILIKLLLIRFILGGKITTRWLCFTGYCIVYCHPELSSAHQVVI